MKSVIATRARLLSTEALMAFTHQSKTIIKLLFKGIDELWERIISHDVPQSPIYIKDNTL